MNKTVFITAESVYSLAQRRRLRAVISRVLRQNGVFFFFYLLLLFFWRGPKRTVTQFLSARRETCARLCRIAAAKRVASSGRTGGEKMKTGGLLRSSRNIARVPKAFLVFFQRDRLSREYCYPFFNKKQLFRESSSPAEERISRRTRDPAQMYLGIFELGRGGDEIVFLYYEEGLFPSPHIRIIMCFRSPGRWCILNSGFSFITF